MIDANRCTVRRPPTPDKDALLRERMRELADKRKRFGSRRLHILLREEGYVVNHKRTERIYREEGLALRAQTHKKQHAATRVRVEAFSRSDECWAMDFVHDNLTDGRAIRILTMIDLFDRTCPHIEAGFSQSGMSVVSVLNRLKELGRLPRMLRTDNGPEFISHALRAWAEANGVKIDNTRPGKPTDNAEIESFNGRLRDECLNMHIFATLKEAKAKIEEWRFDYNRKRPHGSLGWLTPDAYKEINKPQPERKK